MASGLIVPPGGFAGYNQMTPASRAALFRTSASRPARRSRSRKRVKAASGTSKRRRGKSGGRMKFGSPAWQKKYRVGRYAKRR